MALFPGCGPGLNREEKASWGAPSPAFAADTTWPAGCLPLLLSWLPCHDGLEPWTVSRNEPFLSEASFVKYFYYSDQKSSWYRTESIWHPASHLFPEPAFQTRSELDNARICFFLSRKSSNRNSLRLAREMLREENGAGKQWSCTRVGMLSKVGEHHLITPGPQFPPWWEVVEVFQLTGHWKQVTSEGSA